MKNEQYWEEIAAEYQAETVISTDDFHYGPLIAGDSTLKLLPETLERLDCLEVGCGGAQNDPLFIDPADDNYRLQDGSPAAGKGYQFPD